MIPLRQLAALGPLLLVVGLVPGQGPAPKAVPTLTLLLDTFRLVEGPAERVGDVYRIRAGGQVREIPAGQVLYAGESRADVQKFLAAHAAKRTPVARPATDGSPLNSAAFPLFAAKVQPILMNVCARCHCDPASAGGLVLERVPLGYADPDATRRNARAVTPFIRPDDPGSSPLLAKAIAAHGDLRDPPLPSPAHPAFHNLALWVHLAVAPDSRAAPAVIPPPGAKPATTGGARPMTVAPAPIRQAVGDDPFSPDAFNRLVGGTR